MSRGFLCYSKMSRQRRVLGSGIGPDWLCPWFLMIRVGRGRAPGPLPPANSRTLWLSTAQHQGTVGDKAETERERERGTLSYNTTAKETAETLPPPKSSKCTARKERKKQWRQTKAFLAFSLREEEEAERGKKVNNKLGELVNVTESEGERRDRTDSSSSSLFASRYEGTGGFALHEG